MIVLLDCDGVLADFTGGILKVYNERNGTDFTPEDVTDWDIAHSLGIPNRAIYNIASEEGFCAKLNTLPGVVAALDSLYKIADVYCVTSPIHTSRYWMYERTNWLHDLGFAPSHVIQSSAKYLLMGDVFIDDKPRSVLSWVHARNRAFNRSDGDGAFLWAQPYNSPGECFYAHPFSGAVTACRRTDNWQEIIDYVTRHSHGT